MGIDSGKLNEIVTYLTNYLLAMSICFVGCISKETYKRSKSRSKFSITLVIIGTLLCTFISTLINRILSDFSVHFPFEAYMAMCYIIGFVSDVILSVLADKKIIQLIFIALIKTIGSVLNMSAKSFMENYNASKDSNIKPKYYDKILKPKDDNKNNEEKNGG